jgi:hypothetical protein
MSYKWRVDRIVQPLRRPVAGGLLALQGGPFSYLTLVFSEG